MWERSILRGAAGNGVGRRLKNMVCNLSLCGTTLSPLISSGLQKDGTNQVDRLKVEGVNV
jgi:hypothetical protein